MTLKSSKKLPFSVSEGTLTFTPVYSKLEIMLLPALTSIKVTKCKKKKKPKPLHTYTQHCLNSKFKVFFLH